MSKSTTDAQTIADRINAPVDPDKVDTFKEEMLIADMKEPCRWHITRLRGYALTEVWGLDAINAAMLDGKAIVMRAPELITRRWDGDMKQKPCNENEAAPCGETSETHGHPEWLCLMWMPEETKQEL